MCHSTFFLLVSELYFCFAYTGTPKIVKPERNIDNEVMNSKSSCLQCTNVKFSFPAFIWLLSCFNQKPAAAKASSMFGGTRDKCSGCQKTVYPTEKVIVYVWNYG